MEPIPRGVMWEEGLFLQPHHLQQQALARYALAARFAGRAHPHLWGVVELGTDPLALERGQLVVLRLEAVSARVPREGSVAFWGSPRLAGPPEARAEGTQR